MFITAIMICSIFAAFRGNVGTDSLMYQTTYAQETRDFEIGYLLLMNLLRFLRLPYQGLFFVMEFLSMLLVCLTIRRERNSINVFLATYIAMSDFYFFSWNTMRQQLASAMCMYAIVLYLDKKKFWGIIFIAAACLFHYSALICLIVVGAKLLFDNRHSKCLMAAVFLLALYLVNHRALFGEWVQLLTGSSYYASYITRDANSNGSLLTYYGKAFPALLIATMGYYRYKSNRKYKVIYGLMICGYILASLGSITATQVQRMGYYFTYLNIILMGYLGRERLKIAKGIYISRKSVAYIIYAYFFTLFVYNLFIRGFSDLVPYSWFV